MDNLVHDDGDQKVEEDGGDVLQAGGVEDELLRPGGSVERDGDVVVKSNEERGQRGRHLEHEPNDKDHRHASHDVRMVRDDEVVGEDRRVLVGRAALDSHFLKLVQS